MNVSLDLGTQEVVSFCVVQPKCGLSFISATRLMREVHNMSQIYFAANKVTC